MKELREKLGELSFDVCSEYRDALLDPAFQNLPKEAYKRYMEALNCYVEYCESLCMALEACISAEEERDTTATITPA